MNEVRRCQLGAVLRGVAASPGPMETASPGKSPRPLTCKEIISRPVDQLLLVDLCASISLTGTNRLYSSLTRESQQCNSCNGWSIIVAPYLHYKTALECLAEIRYVVFLKMSLRSRYRGRNPNKAIAEAIFRVN